MKNRPFHKSSCNLDSVRLWPSRLALSLFAVLLLSVAACTTGGYQAGASLTPPTTVAPVPENDDTRSVAKFSFISNYTDWKPLGAVSSWKLTGDQAVFTLEDGRTVLVSFPANNVYRLRFNPLGDYSRDASYAVVNRTLSKSSVTGSETGSEIELTTPLMSLRVAKAAFAVTVLKDGAVLSADTRPISTAGSRVVSWRDVAPGDRYFGFGEKAGDLKKNGTSMKMWNTDAYGWGNSTDTLYMSIPFFMNIGERGSWAILFDNTYQTFFDMGKTHKEEMYFGASGGEMDYWFISGTDAASLLKDYTGLTGRAPMPPEWALGYQQSRYSYMNEKEVTSLASAFREKKIPADVIYFDIDFMDKNRAFTNSASAFPDPARLLKDLKKQGFKAITIIDPGIKIEEGYPVYDSGMAVDAFVKDGAGKIARGEVWPGICAFPDFGKPATDAWWGEQYKKTAEWGFDAIWNDMNEPAAFNSPNGTLPFATVHYDSGGTATHAKMHNVYGLLMARATMAGLDKVDPVKRNFVLSRAGYAGSQRYASTWTGDNTASWEHLKLNVTMVIGLGLSGIPFSGADVGGYINNPSPELFSRWMQVGALLPFYRNHTGKGNKPHEPWEFGSEAEAVSKQAVELRYALMPYLYGLARGATLSGAPMVRPLFYHYPNDSVSYDVDDEFLLGDSLLAAPVIREGSVTREVYFPTGTRWVDWLTGKAYEGGTSYTIDTPLTANPLYARAGSIVPVRDVEQWVGEKTVNPVTLRIFPGAACTYSLYQDDGATTAFKSGDYLETKIDLAQKDADITVTVEPTHKPKAFKPRTEQAFLEFNLEAKPASVKVDGKSVAVTEGSRVVGKNITGAWWDAVSLRLTVSLTNLSASHAVNLKTK